MSENNFRQRLIEECLEKRLPRFETNKILIQHQFDELEGGEADCYDVMINSAQKSNPRQKIIAGCLIQGLSKASANLKLYENKFRKLSGEEITYYEDVLSRIRFCGVENRAQEWKNQEYIPDRNDAVEKGILNKLSAEELNHKLKEYGYTCLSSQEAQDYKIKLKNFHNKREAIIKDSINSLKSLDILNRMLIKNNLPKLNMLEEMDYQNEREKIYSKQRDNLIKECIAERLSKAETDRILVSKGFSKLSDQEIDKINKQNKSVNMNRTKRKSTELSEQFRKLYRKAIKQFHPDKFSDCKQKAKATNRMKEINAAKDRNDFFMLKDLIQKFEEDDKHSPKN